MRDQPAYGAGPAQPEGVDYDRSPRWGPARLLRLCTGVDEAILAREPSERARYTAMGGVVLGTALMAMLSMSYALYCVFDGFRPIIVAVVLVWGMFILSIDRWLMSGPPLSEGGGVWRKALPRVVLSITLGVIVAEPLLLGVFDSAIQERVATTRKTELDDREALLRTCNPIPGSEEAGKLDPARCDGALLKIDATPPDVLRRELDETKRQQESLREQFDADSKEYADLEEKARRECNGTSGPGLTGRRGVGPNCDRLREEADTYYRTHQLAESGERLDQLDKKAKDLTGRIGTAETTYADATTRAIEADLDKIQARHRGVGLLERFRALGTLVDESGYVLAAEWAIRLFLIIIDALPIVLKVMNGSSAHDRALARRIRDNDHRAELAYEDAMRQHREEVRLASQRAERERRGRQLDHSQAIRVQYANQEEDRDELISARERKLMRLTMAPPLDAWELESTHEFVIDHDEPTRSDPAGTARGDAP